MQEDDEKPSNKKLWREIDSVFTLDFSHRLPPQQITKFHTHLRDYKPILINPLKTNARKEESRKAVESGTLNIDGKTLRLSPEFIKETLELSSILDVNEIDCLQLLRSANQQQSRYVDLEAREIAAILFFEDRKFLLHSLLHLLKARQDTKYSDDLRDVIAQFTNGLLVEGLGTNLLQHLGNATKRINQIAKNCDNTLLEFMNEERRLFAECIFYIYYQTTIRPGDLTRLFQVFVEAATLVGDLQQLANTRKTSTQTNALAVPVMESIKTAYILMLSIISILDANATLVDPRTGDQTHNELSDSNNMNTLLDFHKQLTSTQLGNPQDMLWVQTVQLAWALFLKSTKIEGQVPERNVDQLVHTAIEKNIMTFLKRILETSAWQQDTENREIFADVLNELVVCWLQYNYWDVQDSDGYLADFLEFLSALYKNEGVLSLLWWEFSTHMHSFVRYAGERCVATPNLFIAYLHFVSSLASGSAECAQYAYHFVKNTTNKFVNWDHFFSVFQKYYIDLQEIPSEPTGYGYGYSAQPTQPKRKVLSPDDVKALQAILQLLYQVLRGSEDNRLLMHDNPSWHVIDTLFGLLGCPVPPGLKASILDAVSAFALSPELVGKIWQFIEASQIVPTVSSAPTLQKPTTTDGGIKFEIDEVEARNEEYPYAISFLNLLYQLINMSGIPSHLGLPYRVPGFGPYLSLVRDHIFFKFDTRPYHTPFQKWKVAAHALRVLAKVLERYEIPPEDFVDQYLDIQGKPVVASKSAGYELMMSCLSGNNGMLAKMFGVLHQGIKTLQVDRYTENGEYYEEAVLLSLKMIEQLFIKELPFMESMSKYSRSPKPLVPMDQLLLRDRQIIVTIAKLISYAPNSAIPLLSVKIINSLSQRESIQGKLVSIFVESNEDINIAAEYAARLEADETIPTIDTDGADVVTRLTLHESQLDSSVRLNIVNLMLNNLHGTTPNMTHMLIGYNPADPNANILTALETKGPVTCLHVIIGLLANESFAEQHPELCERSYELLYQLAHDKLTCNYTLRTLRNTARDFFFRQLQLLTTRYTDYRNFDSVHYLYQRAWLLKLIALEMHVSPSMDHRNKLLQLLYNIPLLDNPEEFDYDMERQTYDQYQSRTRILNLLDDIFERPLSDPPSLRTTVFTNLDLNALSCMLCINFADMIDNSRRGVKLIDIATLHRALNDEKRRLETSGTLSQSQVDIINQEIHHILEETLKHNQYSLQLAGKSFVFESWKQIVSITVAKPVCYDFIVRAGKENIVYELIATLLQILNRDTTRIVLASSISECVLILITKLRERKIQSTQYPLFAAAQRDNTFVSGVIFDTPIENLAKILGGIVNGIIRNDTTQFMRGNLYASLLNYLQMTDRSSMGYFTLASSQVGLPVQSLSNMNLQPAEYVSLTSNKRLHGIEEFDTQERLLYESNMIVLERDAIKLIRTISMDASDANEAWKTLAFSTLDVLVRYDRKHQFVDILCDTGFLSHFINQIKSSEQFLIDMLTTNPESLRPLYVYESVMSLLNRIAQTIRGTNILVQYDAINVFAKCSYIDQRPDDIQMDTSGWLPSVMERYDELLMPVLRLMLTMLTNNPASQDVVGQVLFFVDSHSELINTILKDRIPSITTESLECLRLVTEIFYFLARHQDVMQFRLQNKTAKIHIMMLNLLAKYCSKDRWQPLVRSNIMQEDDAPKEFSVIVRDITKNLIAYARITSEFKDSKYKMLFSPKITAGDNKAEQDIPRSVTTRGWPPTLTVLVEFIKSCLDEHLRLSVDRDNLNSKLNHIIELSSEELNAIISQSQRTAPIPDDFQRTLTPNQRQMLAQMSLTDLITAKTRELNALLYMLENALLLLWRHLDFYVNVSPFLPSPEMNGLGLDNNTATSLIRAPLESLSIIPISPNELKQLKAQAAAGLSQTVPGQRETTLSLISKLESKKINNNIIYCIVRKLRDLLRNPDQI